ncbi:MAG: hypothetical protein LC128_10280 [Chitinophagales bacterium]|nr:hypothetical protein [Chitinophagales bacterium]
MEAHLSNGRKGRSGKPSIFTGEEHKKIERELKDPKNRLQGYIELQQWIEQKFHKKVSYNTLLKYARRHFGVKMSVSQ